MQTVHALKIVARVYNQDHQTHITISLILVDLEEVQEIMQSMFLVIVEVDLVI
jgi:hypothetical protein